MAWDDCLNVWGHLEPICPIVPIGVWDTGFDPDYNNPFTQMPPKNPFIGFETDPNNPFSKNRKLLISSKEKTKP